MKGSEFVAAYANAPIATREAAILKVVEDGAYVHAPLVPVPCGPDSYFYAAADYFSIGTYDDFLRVPMGGPTAQKLVDLLGMCLPTPHMVDLVWRAAAVRLAPYPMPAGAAMVTLSRAADHNAAVQTALDHAPGYTPGVLVAGIKKDIVRSIAMTRAPGMLAFYGWHRLNGTPIQGLNIHAHSATYSDYSHGLRLIAPSMIVNGQSMLVDDVLADPRSSALLSSEGPFRGVRYKTEADMNPITVPPTIRLGTQGSTVLKWQRIVGVPETGTFDAATEAATRVWQARRGLTPDGIVGPKTWGSWLSVSENPTAPVIAAELPFVQAAHCFRKGRPASAIRQIVIHTMESPEKPTTAENVAAWFAGPSAPQASAHYCVDEDSIVQCVQDADVAWHVPGRYTSGVYANDVSIGIEHAGYAKRTAEEWASPQTMAMLRLSAQLTARLCKKYDIPVVKLSPAEVVRGEAGLCGHVDVTNGTHCGTHWDPGPNFPWDAYLSMVHEYLEGSG